MEAAALRHTHLARVRACEHCHPAAVHGQQAAAASPLMALMFSQQAQQQQAQQQTTAGAAATTQQLLGALALLSLVQQSPELSKELAAWLLARLTNVGTPQPGQPVLVRWGVGDLPACRGACCGAIGVVGGGDASALVAAR